MAQDVKFERGHIAPGSYSVGDALPEHGICDLLESCDVGSCHEVGLSGGSDHVVLLGRCDRVVVDRFHDVVELLVDLFEGPGVPHGVLAHLECRSGDTAGVGSLGGTVKDTVLLVDLDCSRGAGHVGSLSDGEASVLDEDLCGLLADLVLSGAGECDVAGNGPDSLGSVLVLEVFGILDVVEVGLYPVPLLLFDDLDGLVVDTVLIDDVTVGVGHGDDLGTVLGGLLAGVDGDISGSGDDDPLALEGFAFCLEHLVGVVTETESGGLGPGEGSACRDGLTGEDSGELVSEPLVLAVHESDLPSAGSDVSCGDVGVGTDVLLELGHE